MRRKVLGSVLGALIVLAGAAPSSALTLLFDQTQVVPLDSVNMLTRIQADDFSVSDPSLVLEVAFTTLEAVSKCNVLAVCTTGPQANHPSTNFAGSSYNGSIAWSIFTNSGSDTPDTRITGGLITPSRTGGGTFINLFGDGVNHRQFNYDFFIPATAVAPGVTYWLLLHNGPANALVGAGPDVTTTLDATYVCTRTSGAACSDNEKFLWMGADADLNGSSATLGFTSENTSLPPGAWLDNGTNQAFALYGVNVDVPEPGSLALLGLGAAMLFGGLRRKK